MSSLAHSPSAHTQPGAAKAVADLPQPGDTVRVGYPFVRDTFYTYDEEGGYEAPTWRPGVRYESDGPESMAAFADGEGEMRLTVVDTFKPGRYPTRVFVTRRFVRPDGAEFGKGKLHIWTIDKFRRLTKGYAQPYELVENDSEETTTANSVGTSASECTQ